MRWESNKSEKSAVGLADSYAVPSDMQATAETWVRHGPDVAITLVCMLTHDAALQSGAKNVFHKSVLLCLDILMNSRR